MSIYGVSTDDVESHRPFCESESLEFDLFADPDGEVQAVYEGVDPNGHAREVLRDALEEEEVVTLAE